jgi:hypothetical protein
VRKKVVVVLTLIVAALVAFAAAATWRFSSCRETLPFAVDRAALKNSGQLLASLGAPSEVIATTAREITALTGPHREFAPSGSARMDVPDETSVIILTWKPSCARSNHAVVAIVNRDTDQVLDVHTHGTLR